MRQLKGVLIVVGIIATAVLMLLALLNSNLFDTSGGYTSDMIGKDEQELLTFEETAYVPEYQKACDNWEDFKDEKVFYYLNVDSVEREVRNHIDEYLCTAVLSEEMTKELRDLDKYPTVIIEGTDRAIVPVLVKANTEKVKQLMVGDYCWVYGYLIDNTEAGEYESIPVLDARKIKLDLDIDE